MSTPLRLSNVEAFAQPFHYIVSPQFLEPDISLTVLAWLESAAPWQLVEADFYTQFECSLWDVALPPTVAFLREQAFMTAMKERIGELFGVDVGHRVDITAHKLVSGQRIRLHNDFLPGGETHRLLIQFNRGWVDNNGGFLLLFHSADPADVHKIFRPIHNSALGFAITATSYHAVSTIHAGERFTLVYSFYEQPSHA